MQDIEFNKSLAYLVFFGIGYKASTEGDTPLPLAYCVLPYFDPAYCVLPYFDIAYCVPFNKGK